MTRTEKAEKLEAAAKEAGHFAKRENHCVYIRGREGRDEWGVDIRFKQNGDFILFSTGVTGKSLGWLNGALRGVGYEVSDG